MRRILPLLVLLLIVGLVVGCGNSPVTEPTPTPTVMPTPTPTPTPTPIVTNGDEPPVDRTWISPGKVKVGNFYPGARAEWPITIHNGNDYEATFQVSYRYPDKVADGYVYPTPEVQDWVIIVGDGSYVLAPYETKEVLIVLDMPYGVQAPGREWEFWISVKEATQTGMVTTELCSRWQIQMSRGW